jgi:hypothetical protein
MKHAFITFSVITLSMISGCGLPSSTDRTTRDTRTTTTASIVSVATSTPDNAFEDLLNTGDTPSTESEMIPYEKLISVAEFHFEIIGTKPLQKIKQIVLAEPGWTTDSVQDVFIANFDSYSVTDGSAPAFSYHGPVKLSPGSLQIYARSTKSPKIVMDSLRLIKASAYNIPARSHKTIRDWLANTHNYTDRQATQPIDLTKFEKVVGATVGVPNSDGIWEVTLYAQKGWQTNTTSTFYLQTSMNDLGNTSGKTIRTTYGPFTDNVSSLINQAHYLHKSENLSAHIHLYSDVFSARSL